MVVSRIQGSFNYSKSSAPPTATRYTRWYTVFRVIKVHTQDRSLCWLAVLFRPEYSAHLGKVGLKPFCVLLCPPGLLGRFTTVHRGVQSFKNGFLTLYQLIDEGCLRSFGLLHFFFDGFCSWSLFIQVSGKEIEPCRPIEKV